MKTVVVMPCYYWSLLSDDADIDPFRTGFRSLAHGTGYHLEVMDLALAFLEEVFSRHKMMVDLTSVALVTQIYHYQGYKRRLRSLISVVLAGRQVSAACLECPSIGLVFVEL